jgi:endonuclease/exonuclease/phosphatase (EEP) superfamily protein YafD
LAAIDLYVAGLGCYLVLRLAVGDRWGAVAFISALLHWALLPTFLFLPLALRARRWPVAVLLSLNALVFLVLYGGQLLPHLGRGTAESHVRVMTYNLGSGRVPPEALVELLADAGTDVVGLQELAADQAAAIEGTLAERYPYRVLHGTGVAGIGLLSRYPILEHELFYLEAQRLPHLWATVALEEPGTGEPVTTTLIVAHPPPPGFQKKFYAVSPVAGAEVASLARMGRRGAPSILLGDFNLVDQSDNYTLLADEGLKDAFRVAGWGFGATWPAGDIWPLPALARVDYVWYTAPFRARRAWVGPDVGSDHLPVVADLIIVRKEVE